MTDGIYTLANDVVYDQLVALLNSIEVNAGRSLPVCVIAYDERLDRVRAEVATRPNVSLLDDPRLLARWDDFSQQVWQTHPTALHTWQQNGISGVYRLGSNHRYAAFDQEAPFERFLYLDADTLVLGPVDDFFEFLQSFDCVVYDFQHKHPAHVYNLQSSRLAELFTDRQLHSSLFCAGCYASKRGLFDEVLRSRLIQFLQAGDADILYPNAPNQSVLNYMMMRSGQNICNLALHRPASQVTGNAVTSSHFEWQNQHLYDQGKPITYLHYIGLSATLFQQLCRGKNGVHPSYAVSSNTQ